MLMRILDRVRAPSVRDLPGLAACGWSWDAVAANLDAGRWQRLGPAIVVALVSA